MNLGSIKSIINTFYIYLSIFTTPSNSHKHLSTMRLYVTFKNDTFGKD